MKKAFEGYRPDIIEEIDSFLKEERPDYQSFQVIVEILGERQSL